MIRLFQWWASAAALVVCAGVSETAHGQTPPPWLDRAMGFTLHQPGYYNSEDLRAPTYYHPLEKEYITYEGHAEKLAEALAQKARRFGATIVRKSLTLSVAQPMPGDYRTLAFYHRLVQAFARQGIAVILQLDSPPGWMSPIGTESFARDFANQSPTAATGQVVPNTDLALYDQIWQQIIEPAQQLGTPLKPAGENRIILSGRNEPIGVHAPRGHPTSIGLYGPNGEWDRMVRRFQYLDNRDGNRDMLIGSIETLGLNASDPVDCYTTHDYQGIGFPNRNQINILSEVGDWVAYPNAHAALKYWAVQRSFGNTWGTYVAHIVDDCDMGDRPSGGSPRGQRGKFWSDTQPQTPGELNLDTWDEALSGGVGSRIGDLRGQHPWLSARASNTIVRDNYNLVITHNSVPFYKRGMHPDSGTGKSGSYGYELPGDQFAYDIYVRNLGSRQAEVQVGSPKHNFRNLTLTPANFTLPVDGVQRVRVAFDCSNQPVEGYHAAVLRAFISNSPSLVLDRIPLVVLSDLDHDPNANEPLIANNELRYEAHESIGGDLKQYREGSQVAVYRAAPGKAFALSHLRFHFGGQGGANYNAVVTVDAWDEVAGRWDDRHGLVFRVDGNMQNTSPYATTESGAPSGMRFTRMDWPVAYWSNPLLNHSMGFDGKDRLTAIRVTILSNDNPSFPETFAKQTKFEVFGKTFQHRPPTSHVIDDFSLPNNNWTDPDQALTVRNGRGNLTGSNIVRASHASYAYKTGIASVRLRLANSDWAALRLLMNQPDDGPWGASASGYSVRITGSPSGASLTVDRSGSTPTVLGTVNGLSGDPTTTFRSLSVQFDGSDPNGTKLEVSWDGNIVLQVNDPGGFSGPGYVGFTSYTANPSTGQSRFDDFEVNPAPTLTSNQPEGPVTYQPGTLLRFGFLDLDAFRQVDLDLGLRMSPTRGCGMVVSFLDLGDPNSRLEFPLHWSNLEPFLRIDPVTLEVSFEFASDWIGPLLLLSNGTPVDLRLMAQDLAGSKVSRTTSFR